MLVDSGSKQGGHEPRARVLTLQRQRPPIRQMDGFVPQLKTQYPRTISPFLFACILGPARKITHFVYYCNRDRLPSLNSASSVMHTYAS